MDIAALSMAMSQVNISQEVDVSVLKMAMDNSLEEMEALKKIMELSINPNLGSRIDISL